MTQRQSLGRRGEALARRHLESRGYVVLETNYRTRGGEIDLVTEHGGKLVFVEVRTTSTRKFGSPEESITRKKREHLIHAARHYLNTLDRADRDWRVDVVAIELVPGGGVDRLEIVENALET